MQRPPIHSFDAEESYDLQKFTDEDLAAIKEIHERLNKKAARASDASKIKDDERSLPHADGLEINKDEVYTVEHSLAFAEQQLQERIRKNL